jgi:uncharacterized protein (TIGR02145 family)
MKVKIILSLLFSLSFYLLFSQVPQGFNYQAIARDGDGNLIKVPFYIKVEIQNLAADTIFWIEEHNVTPNEYGLISFVVGQTGRIGGTAINFEDIDWISRPRYLKTSANLGTGYSVMGTTQIMSVPYSLVAKNVESPIGKLTIKGTTTKYDEALFEVKNQAGQIIFAVYNEGVRIYVDNGDETKGVKGGFSVGGFGTDKDPSQPYLVVKPDTVRIYIDTPGKGKKGGFAIGGYGSDKQEPQQYLFVSSDSIRAYIDTASVKGTKGGFAIGGFGTSKGVPNNYMFIDPDSTRFYVRELDSGNSSTFDIIGINLDQSQTLLMTANTDTVGIGGVLSVQNNLIVQGNIGYTGSVGTIIPELTTIEAFNISDTSAMVACNITNNGGAAVIVSGVCWSTSPDPTVSLTTKTTDGTSLGQYTSVITGLTESTTYYVRAYATNSNGTGYGSEITFITPAQGTTVLDYDGNVYNIIVIGTQTWTASNLRTTSLNDGTSIANVTDDAAWMVLSTPAYAWYNNNAVTNDDYGLLYNWTTVNTSLLCPAGWHVPSDAEWATLISYLGGNQFAGGILKEVGTTHWLDPNMDATDGVGFTALPGGMRGNSGPFTGIGVNGNFWTSSLVSTDPSFVVLYNDSGEMFMPMTPMATGLSVRCMLDGKK